jgi:hypothetical protein
VRPALAVATAAVASIFLAVTKVLLPVSAGEDYSGSRAARWQPGRLFLLLVAAITSLGRVESC